MTTGEKIREARIKAGLTEKELGDAIGISGERIFLYESCYTNPNINTLMKIASYLSLDLSFISEDMEKKYSITGMQTGAIIRKYRLKSGMSRRELAVRAGITIDTVVSYECGKRNPKINTLKKFADALGVNYKSLLPD